MLDALLTKRAPIAKKVAARLRCAVVVALFRLLRQIDVLAGSLGRILEPFAGSGTTLVAAQMEGFGWTGCKVTEHYAQVTRERLAAL